MGFLDPKPLTPGALDAVAAGLVANPASDLGTALSATIGDQITAEVPDIVATEVAAPIAAAVAPKLDKTAAKAAYAFKAIPPDARIPKIADRVVMASPPTVTNGASAPAGWTVRRVHSAPADGAYWAGFRVSGGAHGTNQVPTGVTAATPQFSPGIEFDIEVLNTGEGFALEVNCTTNSFIQVWINEEIVHATPQQTSTLGGATGNRKIAYALTPGYYRVRVQTAFIPNSPIYVRSIYTPPTVGVFPPSIPSRRMFVVGDSYSAAVGTTALTTSVPNYIRAYSLSLGLRLGIPDVWNAPSIPGTGFLGSGSGSTPTQTHLLKLQALMSYVRDGDLLIIQGSINDGGLTDRSATLLTAITDFVAYLAANAPRVQVIYTSPLYMKTRTTETDNAYNWTKAAYIAAGVTWVDVYGPAERIFSGTGNVGAVTGDGNADYYAADETPSPSQHPSNAGHDVLAKVLATKISPLLRDNLTPA